MTVVSSMVHPDRFFREAVGQISDTLDMDIALARLLDYVKGFLPVNRLMVFCFDFECHMMKNLALASVDTEEVFPEYLALDDEGVYRTCFEGLQPYCGRSRGGGCEAGGKPQYPEEPHEEAGYTLAGRDSGWMRGGMAFTFILPCTRTNDRACCAPS